MKKNSIDNDVNQWSAGTYNVSVGFNKIELYKYKNVKKGSIIGIELSPSASVEIQTSPTLLSDYLVLGNQIYKLSYEKILALRFKSIVNDLFYAEIVYLQKELTKSITNFSAKFEAYNESTTIMIHNEESCIQMRFFCNV